MKMEEPSLKIIWFFLSILILFQQLLATGFSLEVAKDENGVTQSNHGKDIDLNVRMTNMEAKSMKQEREIEVLHTLLEEEKNFSKQLSDRISQLEASSIPIIAKSDQLLGRPKRPFRLLPPNFTGDAKESSNIDQSKQFFGPPTNCHEVGQLGYTLNGYYLIKRRDDSNENGKIGVVYCRFQQIQKMNPSLQESIGILDVKTKNVHFYVQRNSSFVKANSVISFELARLNKGGAMNLVSGIFTAPVTGVYNFQFTGVKDSSSNCLDISLQVNGGNVGFAYTEDFNRSKAAFVISLTSSLQLKVKDRVNLYNRNEGILYDDSVHLTHFTGWLVDEE